METRFIKKQMTAAYQYSYTRLALNYYTLYETLTEEPELPGKGSAFLLTLNELIEAYLEGKELSLIHICIQKDYSSETDTPPA